MHIMVGGSFKYPAWTADREKRLRQLFSENLSAAQIAAEMGGLTRNAVLGKIFRLGLSSPRKKPAKTWKDGRIRMGDGRMRVEKSKAVVHRYTVNGLPCDQATDISADDVPVSQRRTITTLTAGSCRWPCGESPEHFFCGAQVADDKPYCPAHCRRAYRNYTREFATFDASKVGHKIPLDEMVPIKIPIPVGWGNIRPYRGKAA